MTTLRIPHQSPDEFVVETSAEFCKLYGVLFLQNSIETPVKLVLSAKNLCGLSAGKKVSLEKRERDPATGPPRDPLRQENQE